jgi:hypothetical protein
MAKAFANAMTFKKATVRASISFGPASAGYKSLLQELHRLLSLPPS